MKLSENEILKAMADADVESVVVGYSRRDSELLEVHVFPSTRMGAVYTIYVNGVDETIREAVENQFGEAILPLTDLIELVMATARQNDPTEGQGELRFSRRTGSLEAYLHHEPVPRSWSYPEPK